MCAVVLLDDLDDLPVGMEEDEPAAAVDVVEPFLVAEHEELSPVCRADQEAALAAPVVREGDRVAFGVQRPVNHPMPVDDEHVPELEQFLGLLGEVEVELEPDKPLEFSLYLRIPSWSEWSEVEVNGAKLEEPRPGAYYMIRRTWRRGDRVRLSLDMSVKLIKAHPFVLSCSGRVAVKRGPLIYCFEQADNPMDVWSIALPSDARLEPHCEENLLGGVVTLRGRGYALNLERWKDVLYAPVASRTEMVPVEVKAIPYYAWANREPGPMIMWVHSREQK